VTRGGFLFFLLSKSRDCDKIKKREGKEGIAMKKTVDVVAALIYRTMNGEQEFMICQRGAHKPRPLAWEFVGGKVESGESFPDALIRECREELDVLVRPGKLFMETIHEYPDIVVHLHLFYTEIEQGEPKLLEHNDLRWVTPPMISQFDFCPADDVILSRILMDYAREKIPTGRCDILKVGNMRSLELPRIPKRLPQLWFTARCTERVDSGRDLL
jgi:8-oxo-dGTP diphosphatase